MFRGPFLAWVGLGYAYARPSPFSMGFLNVLCPMNQNFSPDMISSVAMKRRLESSKEFHAVWGNLGWDNSEEFG